MPDFKTDIRAKLAGLNLAPEREAEIVEELSQHLQEQYEQTISHGTSEEEARRTTLESLTVPDSLGDELEPVERPLRREQTRFGAENRRNRLSGVADDLRFGLRMLAKNPGFTVVAILTLAIGIGASTAMLSVVQDVLVRPLPYAHSDRLYAIYANSDSLGQTRIAASGPDFLDYHEQNKSFAHIAEYTPHFTFTWTGEGEPRLVNCTAASEDFFAMLGIQPYLGRLYEPREYTYLENDTIIVSYRFWKNRLGSDLKVIGRVVHFEGQSQTICGVLPPMSDLFPDTDVWPKLTTRPSWPYMQWRGNKFLRVIGELKPGVSPAMADDDLTAILRRAPEEPRDVRVRLVPLKDDLIGNVRLPLFATLGAAALILVVACINVAALLLARAVKRQGEMAVRLSLGAGLPRIAQQLVTEAMLLSAAACALGLLLAWSILRLLAHIPNLPLPRADGVHLNAPALLVTAGVAIAVTLLFGWIPSLSFSRLNISSALRPRGFDLSGRRGSSLSALVVAEIACSIVLTVSVGLLVHSFWRVMHVNPGYESQSLLRIYLRTNYYTEAGRAFWNDVLREASSLPAIRSAALSDWRPGRDAATATLIFDDRPNDEAHLPVVDGSWISADFFRTVGALLIAGRFFTEHDTADAPAVVIINTEAARQFWPGQDPIGKQIGINYTGPGRRTDGSVPRLREVVGVVGSMKHGALDGPTAPAVYMPYLQDETNHDMASMNLLVRTEGNPMGLADSLRNRIHAIQPDQPVDIRTVEELVSQSVAPRRYTLILLGVFAAIGLLLAAIGVYGVISYATSQRTREFGVRIALGATRGRVISHVLRGGAVLTVLGSGVGIGGALVVTRSLSTLLFEVSPLDVFSFSAAVAVLAVVSVLACLVPAWRASRVDPIIAIQSE